MPIPYTYRIQVGSFCIFGGGQAGQIALVTEEPSSKSPIGFSPPQSPPVSDPAVPAVSDNGHKERQSDGGDDDR